jgi:hypothetical protein
MLINRCQKNSVPPCPCGRSLCLKLPPVSNSKIIFLLSLLLSSFSHCYAQSTKSTTSREQVWVAYFNQTRISKNFGAWLDVQHRQTGEFLDRPFQFLFRPALTWFAKDNLRVNVGYAFINHFPPEGQETSQPEHRAWQQVWFNHASPRFTMLQWLRLEQRFVRYIENDVLVEGYTRRNRIRYNIGLTVPLKGEKVVPGVPFVSISNELFMNLGKTVVYNTFDQNRLFIGLGYQIADHVNVQAGYLNAYQQQPSGNQYVVSHVVRVALFHNLDLRGE